MKRTLSHILGTSNFEENHPKSAKRPPVENLALLQSELDQLLHKGEYNQQLSSGRPAISLELEVDDQGPLIPNIASAAIESTQDDEDDDDFWSNFADEIHDQVATVEKIPTSSIEQDAYTGLPFARYSVLYVHYEAPRTLVIRALKLPELSVLDVRLSDRWYDTHLEAGDTFHILPPELMHVNNKEGMLITHPDLLVAGTMVAESSGCLRRSILKSRIRSSDIGPAQIRGTVAHSFLQQIMTQRRTPESDKKSIHKTLRAHAASLHAARISSLEATTQLETIGQRFTDEWKNGAWKVDQVIDIEENVWSPTLGLKGKLDATLYVHNAAGTADGLAPLEIKTGKVRPEAHRAQTALYALMMTDRYPPSQRTGMGLLCQVGDQGESQATVSVVPTVHGEVADLMHLRNSLAKGLSQQSFPSVLGPGRAMSECNRCFSRKHCFVLHQALENGTKSTAGISEGMWESITSHLTSKHRTWLTRWWRLIDLEESHEVNQPIWSPNRSKEKNAVGDLTLVSCEPLAEPGASLRALDEDRWIAHFQSDSAECQSNITSFSLGDLVVISGEAGPWGLNQGFVHSLPRKEGCSTTQLNMISVTLDRPIRVPVPVPNMKFRIDGYDLGTAAVATLRNNIVSIFLTPKSRLRSLIVDLDPPKFQKVPPLSLDASCNLNASQRAVIAHALSAQDYSIVVGMPGSGKSTTLAYLIKTFAQRGLRVLLTSHTHSAVDTVLCKLKSVDQKISILRLGSLERIHPKIQQHTLTALGGVDPDSVGVVMNSAQVIAVTCLGSNHALLHPVKSDENALPMFDVCIVDEASQITLPASLGPLSLSRSFVLVGDHSQLSPVVRSPQAAKEGFTVSLFSILLEAHPRACRRLDVQYRMNEELNELVNHIAYGGQLTCGSEEVAKARLVLRSFPSGPIWLNTILHGPSAIFLDCSSPERVLGTSALDSALGSGVINDVQADIVGVIVRSLVSGGLNSDGIGVITPYRAQLTRIRMVLNKHVPPSLLLHRQDSGIDISHTQSRSSEDVSGVDCCTVDQYQGRDKKVIIVSLVRCNQNGQVISFVHHLKFWLLRINEHLYHH
jgi:DNA replication ATP-dependent helicase Dna2